MKLSQAERKKIKEMKELLSEISFFYKVMQSENMSAETRQQYLATVIEKKKELDKYSPKLNWYLVSEDKTKG